MDAIILAYYNLQLRLTLTQINAKYYVICKSHLPVNNVFKLSDALHTLSSCLFTYPVTCSVVSTAH